MLTTGRRLGSYRIVRQLGEGGMGAVFEAMHEQIERRVAIKVLHPRYAQDPQFATRFLNEARAVNIIDHPALVAISDYGREADGTTFIVMEYLKGESLRARMKRVGAMPLSEALPLARQIASALAAAHGKGIVHRDLKPDNVMLLPDAESASERPKLLDFGIAKLIQGSGEQMQVTVTGELLGTPLYMAPEQCRSAPITDRADVYSLGVMLYHMLAGRPPFVGRSAAELIAMHLMEQPASLQQVLPGSSPEVAELLVSMLRKEPQERPDMGQVAAALGRIAGTGPQSPLAPGEALGSTTRQSTRSEAQTHRQTRKRRSWLLAVGATTAVVGAGVLALSLLRSDLPSHPPNGGKPAGLPMLGNTAPLELVGTLDPAPPLGLWITQCAADHKAMYVWRTGAADKARIAEFRYPQTVSADCGPAHHEIYPLLFTSLPKDALQDIEVAQCIRPGKQRMFRIKAVVGAHPAAVFLFDRDSPNCPK